MSILQGSVVTWTEFASACLSAIINAACNVGSDFKNGIPSEMRSTWGTARREVYRMVTTQSPSAPGAWSQGTNYPSQTHIWYANPGNLVSLVAQSTVESEWATFLNSAGINSRSGKVIQAKELTLAVALYMQFMAYHLKPVSSYRHIYNNANTLWQGQYYKTGTVTPKYTLTAIEVGNIPDVTDSDISNIINQNLDANQLISKYDDMAVYYASMNTN